jgi:hypothetical protein
VQVGLVVSTDMPSPEQQADDELLERAFQAFFPPVRFVLVVIVITPKIRRDPQGVFVLRTSFSRRCAAMSNLEYEKITNCCAGLLRHHYGHG